MGIRQKHGDLLTQTHRSLAFWVQIEKRDFTENLLRWMEHRGVDQARLAEILDVSPRFITEVLRTNAMQ